MALHVSEMCFRPVKIRKSSNFLRCILVFALVLKYSSNIKEGHWLQLLFYFIVLIRVVVSINGMSYSIFVSDFMLKFSRIAVSQKRLQLESKNDSTTTGLILEFFGGIYLISLTSYLHGPKTAQIARLFFFFVDINFFRYLVAGVFSSVPQMCVYFLAIGFCNID